MASLCGFPDIHRNWAGSSWWRAILSYRVLRGSFRRSAAWPTLPWHVAEELFLQTIHLLGQRRFFCRGGRPGALIGFQAQAEAVCQVFEFAHIAWPGLDHPPCQLLGGGRRSGGVVPFGRQAQAMRQQQGNVLAALAQGRQLDAGHVQAVKQVITEVTPL